MTREERLAVGAGEEAEVLRVAAPGDREARLAGELAHLGLLELAEREAQARERGGREPGEHVALVLGGVGCGPQQRALAVVTDARVVTGRERARPEAGRQLDHRVEPHAAVAADAGVRREPRGVPGQPPVDDARPELLAQVDREVRHAEAVGELAGAPHGVGRAAARLAVVLGIGPQLERARDRLAVARDEQRGDRAVNAAAHGDERASLGGSERGVARRGSEGAVERVGRELGGVELRSDQPAELLGDLAPADPGGVEQAAPPRERDGGAAGGLGGAAAARVEARVGDRPAGVVQRERQAHEVSARRTARGAGEPARRDVPATERRLEVLAQLF